MAMLNSSDTKENHPDGDHLETIGAPFDEHIYMLLDVIIGTAITGGISFFGIVSNSINVIMFYRQGPLSHSSTVSLTTMSVSDFFYCVFTCWSCVCVSLEFFVPATILGFKPIAFEFNVGARPALIFSDTTSFVTTFLAVERLFSVVSPFKVKTVFTARRSCVVMTYCFIGAFVFNIPNLFKYILELTLFPGTNITIVSSKNIGLISGNMILAFFYCRVSLRTTIIIIVLLCNVIMTWKVNVSKQIRKSNVSLTTRTVLSPSQNPKSLTQEDKNVNSKTSKADATYNASKEIRLVRMITAVCVLFVICYITDFVYIFVFHLSGLRQGFDFHVYTRLLMYRVKALFQTINSSVNIIIYYIMSSSYKEKLQMCLFKRKL